MGPRFANWLRNARQVQDEVYGLRPVDLEGEAWSAYVQRDFLAAHTELGEALQELPWKWWRGAAGKPDEEARERCVVELIDCLCHVSNIFVALDVTDDELEYYYNRKVAFTAERDSQ